MSNHLKTRIATFDLIARWISDHPSKVETPSHAPQIFPDSLLSEGIKPLFIPVFVLVVVIDHDFFMTQEAVVSLLLGTVRWIIAGAGVVVLDFVLDFVPDFVLDFVLDGVARRSFFGGGGFGYAAGCDSYNKINTLSAFHSVPCQPESQTQEEQQQT